MLAYTLHSHSRKRTVAKAQHGEFAFREFCDAVFKKCNRPSFHSRFSKGWVRSVYCQTVLGMLHRKCTTNTKTPIDNQLQFAPVQTNSPSNTMGYVLLIPEPAHQSVKDLCSLSNPEVE